MDPLVDIMTAFLLPLRALLAQLRIALTSIDKQRPDAKMPYEYEQPRREVFDFFIYSFLSSVVFLIYTGRPKFKKSLKFQYLVTFCVACSAYIFPAAIVFRVAVLHTPKSLPIPRILLLVEFGLCIFFFLCSLLCLVFKHFNRKIQHRSLMDLHEHAEEFLETPSLWWQVMAHFCFRFIAIYFVHIPACLVINILFLALFNPPEISFDDGLFLVSFGLALLAASTWLWVHVGPFQSLAHSELVINSFILTYFASDNEYLAKMLLSSLSIYLVSFYDILSPQKHGRDWYNMPAWFYFQVVFWFNYRHVSIDEFKRPGYRTHHGTLFMRYHDLVYKPKPQDYTTGKHKEEPEDPQENPLGK